MPSRKCLALAAVTLLVGSAASLPPASAESVTGAASPVFYSARLSEPATVDELVAAVTTSRLQVRSVRHAGETTGEMLVGNEPFATAAQKYKQTNLDNFGSEPMVVSFVSTTPPAVGMPVGDAEVTTVSPQETSSLDPTPDGEVGTANIQNAWAPNTGTTYAYNASSGSARQVRHRLSWDSRAGLDSYSDYAYEHDNKLDDPDAELLYLPDGSTICISEHWVAHNDTRIVTSNMPTSAGVYADNARQLEDCGYYDISFGVFKPGALAVNTTYTVVVGGDAGPRSSSPQGLSAQKLSNDCQFLGDGDWCIGLNENRPGTDSEPLIGEQRGWRFPGCYTWTRGGSPVSGSCP